MKRGFRAPGRVNLIGEHTDYNDGFALPMAIDRGITIEAGPLDAAQIRLASDAFHAQVTISLDAPFAGRGDWSDYARAVVSALSGAFPLRGADLRARGDLSTGAGLASSAAFEVALTLALASLAGHDLTPRDLARVATRAEQEYVGVRSGVMDQLIAACGVEGAAMLLDCRSLELTPVALPAALQIVVCESGVKHALASSRYGERRAECETGVRMLREHGLRLNALRDLTAAQFEAVEHILPSPVRECCRHVVFENQRTLDAAEALRRGDLERLGRLANASHESLRDLYAVSCAELDDIVERARRVEGVYGARMTGGGFGGSAIVLLRASEPGESNARLDALREALAEFEVYPVRASSGAYEMILG